MIVVREMQLKLAAEAWLERASRRLQVLARKDKKAEKFRTLLPNIGKGKRDETNTYKIDFLQIGFDAYDAMFWSNYV